MSKEKTIRSITQEQREKYFVDEDGIFTTSNGLKKGVYGVFVQCGEGKEVLMYIGETGKGNRCLWDRLSEHAYYWLSNSKFYCGIKPWELKEGYKFKIKILAEENNDSRRYRLEQYYVETMRPYLQSGPYPKYDSDYRGFDLCIFPTYRRRAFLFARDGQLPFEEVVQKNSQPEHSAKKSLVDYVLDETQKFDWELLALTLDEPEEEVMEAVKEEMPKGSDNHLAVKRRVDRELGKNNGRGCYYDYLVKLVSSAVHKEYYVSKELNVTEMEQLPWYERRGNYFMKR